MLKDINFQIFIFVVCIAIGWLFLTLVFALRERHRVFLARKAVHLDCEARMRGARQVQDTLLQSLQVLVLRFHCAAESIRADDPAKLLVISELEKADVLVMEALECVENFEVGRLLEPS